MGVGAADAERRHRGPARPVRSRATARASVSSRTAPADQSTCGDGSSTCRVRGSTPCRIAMHHLDDAADAGGGLGVADVRLHRAEPQRPVAGAVLAVGGQQRLRLDRVAQRGAGAVRLDRVDVGRRTARRWPAPARMTRCCDGPFGRGQAVAGAVLVDRGAAHHGQHRVAVAPGVGQPLQQQHADALGPAGAVGGGGERLAPAVGGQPALPAELDERRRAWPSR